MNNISSNKIIIQHILQLLWMEIEDGQDKKI